MLSMRLCILGRSSSTVHARKSGARRMGNTFFIIRRNVGRNAIPWRDVAMGSRSGAMTATRAEMRMVYDVVMPASPPSFCVTTEHAVAVGQIRARSRASMTRRYSVLGYSQSSRHSSENERHCIIASHRCKRLGFRSRGDTLQNATKSMQNSNVGCKTSMQCRMSPFTAGARGSSRPTM